MQNYKPYFKAMGMPNEMYTMACMPEEELENMYPEIYFIVYPVVCHHCDTMDMRYGNMYMPSRNELKCIIKNIESSIELNDSNNTNSTKEVEGKQWNKNGRNLQDLIWILFLKELMDRRRPRSYPYGPGFGYGSTPNYGPGRRFRYGNGYYY